MKKRILLLTFIHLCSICLSQQSKIDSLFTVLKTTKEDSNKVNTLNILSNKFCLIGDYEQAKIHSDDALKLAQKLNFEKGKANAYDNIGNIYSDQGKYPDALKNYFASLKIFVDVADTKRIAFSYNNIGNVYFDQGNYPESLKNYFVSLKIFEDIGNKEGIANSYNNIGIIYKNQRNYNMALKNQFASLKIYEEIMDKRGIASCYNNIGNIYKKQGNYSEALKNYFNSLKIKEELSDKKGIANTYGNIGDVYEKQNNYSEGLKNYFISLKKFKEMGNKRGIALTYINISLVNIKLKKLVEAKSYLKEAVSLSKDLGNRDLIKDIYSSFSTLDSAQNNWKDAYEHHKLYIIYRDSLDNEDTKEKTIQASMNYEFDKKEALTKAEQDKKDALSTIEIKKQQIIRYSVSIILLLVILFTFFLYNRLRLIGKQKNIIELKEKETQHQKHLVEEKQKEIIESITYAKRLQEAILPPQDFINKHIKENFILYKPKDIVAGDFYWAEAVNNLFFIAAADSTGHGVPGAMVSVVCSNALNRTIKEFKETETGRILDKTRELVLETFEKSASDVKDGMDISLLCIDNKNKKIFWSGAHNSLWYVTSIASAISVNEWVTELVEIKADKQPIGKTEYPKPFVTHQIEYKEGTTFYLITDGYADQFGGPNGKKFMAKNFKQLLTANSHLPLSKQKEMLETSFNNWVGNLEQVDDVCVIGIKV